jgi:tetratricopeptide (TPR) repeat protein
VPSSVVALSVLARVEPPLYLPLTLRGPRDEAAERFEAAMQHYMERDYAGAIPGLTAAADLNPKAAHITFFLGICHLLADRPDAGIDWLQKTIALGDSPYLEEAHFYAAKARLRQGNIPAAQEELLRTIERRGQLEADARKLRAQVDALAARR